MRSVSRLAPLLLTWMAGGSAFACAADASRGTDPRTDAAVSTASARDAGSPDASDQADAGGDPAAALFDYPRVPSFDLSLPAEAWEELKLNAQDEQYVPAELSFEGATVGTVGLRFKGYYGSLYTCFDESGAQTCPRLSMKVKFDEYNEDQRFYGLKRLNFNAYRYDDSRLKERLTYDLYRAMGVIAPRATWAVLRVNGESLGLFGMVEQLDGRFTDSHFPQAPDGNLYKELWPTEANAESAVAALTTNEETADVSAFVAFATALSAAEPSAARAVLGQYMDLDNLARYMAVDDAVANYDGVTYFWTDGAASKNHNYYLYEAGPTQFTLIPWDVESTFWINPDHAAPHWTVLPADCSQTYAYWEGLAFAPGCDPFFKALGADLSGWRAASRELLEGPFAEEAMLATIDRHAAFIADAAHADPTPSMYVSFDLAVAGLRETIPEMRARLEALIAP